MVRKANIKEYGGYLPLELSRSNNRVSCFDKSQFEVRKYNSGRAAIYMSILDFGATHVWLPMYLCTSVRRFIEKKSIQCSFYNINQDFIPENLDWHENDLVVCVDYFGIIGEATKDVLANSYKNIIFDNTQAFYSLPRKGVYNVYSPRKFFGVSDGGLLISDNFYSSDISLEYSDTLSTAEFLLRSLERTTNEAYPQSIANEKRIDREDVMRMSHITEHILDSIDYDFIKKRRHDNFFFLHELLKEYNELKINEEKIEIGYAPMVYPFLFKSDILRDKLVERHLYVPQWWKAVFEDKKSNSWEKYLSAYLLPLPVDQRYCLDDMEHIADIVRQEIRKAVK